MTGRFSTAFPEYTLNSGSYALEVRGSEGRTLAWRGRTR